MAAYFVERQLTPRILCEMCMVFPLCSTSLLFDGCKLLDTLLDHPDTLDTPDTPRYPDGCKSLDILPYHSDHPDTSETSYDAMIAKIVQKGKQPMSAEYEWYVHDFISC